jgi:hypothetical protein
MKEEELIKKLEKIKIPEIELPSHREGLKATLIEWKYFRKKGWEIFPSFKKIGVLAGSLALILAIFFIAKDFFFPKNNLIVAQKIALKNPEIENLIKEGGEIKDAEVLNSKAYFLIGKKEEVQKEAEKLPLKAEETKEIKEEMNLAEINLKEKKVSKIDKISPQIFPLDDEEKKLAQEIGKVDKEKVLKIESLPTLEIELEKENKELKLKPKEKKALIIYREGNEKWAKRINLTKREIEEIEFLGEE